MKTLKTCAMTAAAIALMMSPASAEKGRNGTTLAASKTVDICLQGDGNWRYSGEVSVWNEGAVDTQDLTIADCIQAKPEGGQYADAYCITPITGIVVPAGTTQATATTFPYSISGAPLAGDIRNAAKVTITNHSGSLGRPFGPQPKATWTGDVLPCPAEGCTYTQGYWANKPDVVWPAPYSRDAAFYLSGSTWQQVFDLPTGGSGYYILAHQYMAAVLNAANGAPVPAGVQAVIDNSTAFFTATAPSACAGTGAGSCPLQKTWGAILADYNEGVYPGGPAHCSDPNPDPGD